MVKILFYEFGRRFDWQAYGDTARYAGGGTKSVGIIIPNLNPNPNPNSNSTLSTPTPNTARQDHCE